MAVSAPPMSKSPWAPTPGSDGTQRSDPATTPIPTGTLTKNTHGHEKAVVRIPPSNRPLEPPAALTRPQAASAWVRSAPSGNVVVRIESEAGVISAAPNPCTARKVSSIPRLPDRPHSSDASVNSATPVTNSRRRPNRSLARPPRSRKPPNISA